MQINKHLTIIEAMEHIKKNISPLAVNTFDEGFKKQTGNTLAARNLGEIELNEPIVDTDLFLRQITMAMYPKRVYPEEWLNKKD